MQNKDLTLCLGAFVAINCIVVVITDEYKIDAMYTHNYRQLEFENFALPFSGGLRSDNRWIKISNFIPWDELESLYSDSLHGLHLGYTALSARIAIGSLIIKKRLGTSDEETVEQIRENPYLQFFLGFKEYKDQAPFYPTMFVHFRKQIGKKTLSKINKAIVQKALAEAIKSSEDKSSERFERMDRLAIL